MYCSQCGKQVPPESRFCPHCGAARDAADIRSGQQPKGAAASAGSSPAPVDGAGDPLATDGTAPADVGLEIQSVDGEVRLDPVKTDESVDEQAAGQEDAPYATDGMETAAAAGAGEMPGAPDPPTVDVTEAPGPPTGEASDLSEPAIRDAAVRPDDSAVIGQEDARHIPAQPDVPAFIGREEEKTVMQTAPDHEAAVHTPADSAADSLNHTGHPDLRGGFSRPPARPAPTSDIRAAEETVIITHPAQNDPSEGTDGPGTAGAELSADGAAPPPAPRRKRFHLLWIAPLVCLLLVGAAVAALYVYHEQQHREVRGLLTEGEELALANQFPQGLARIEQALAKRPSHPALLEHQTVLEDAIALQEDVAAAKNHIEEERYDEAAAAIEAVKEQLQWRSGPVYEQLQDEVQGLEEASVFAGARAELAARSTVTELIPLMNRLRSYEGEEAETFRAEIREKAVELAQEAASEYQAAGDFPSALSVVDEALSLAPDNGDLTALKAEIEAEQAEAAARAASEQARQGQQDPQQIVVEILEFQVQLDAQGRFHVQGILKNVSQSTLQAVRIHYNIFDDAEQLLEQHTVVASPQMLAPGAEAGFEAYHEDGEKMYRAIVTRVEWKVD